MLILAELYKQYNKDAFKALLAIIGYVHIAKCRDS